jgi:STE24 endopeptidase
MEKAPVVVLLASICTKVVVELWLAALNLAEGKKRRDNVPAAFKDVVTKEDYKKSLDYMGAKGRFGMISEFYDGVLMSVLALGGLSWVYGYVGGAIPNFHRVDWDALVLLLVLMALSLPGLPLEWWSQFRLEEKFGFNKSTAGLWVSDKLKGAVLMLVLGWPPMVAVLWIFESFPGVWWMWAWGVFFAFQLVMMILYPMLVLPLFNKLAPLEDGDLKKALMDLADKAGFAAKTIQVIDGSKRSTHSNAYFTGFGKFRRIVLYDTLIGHLTPRELMAVLAHEIGHYKKGHVPQMLAVSAILSFGGFWFINWLVSETAIVNAFGFAGNERAACLPALLLFMVFSGVFVFWIGPVMNFWSRKNEFEADAFAREVMNDAQPLVNALRSLHAKNLSNLVPHPAYSFFHYSHPTLLERESALAEKGKP